MDLLVRLERVLRPHTTQLHDGRLLIATRGLERLQSALGDTGDDVDASTVATMLATHRHEGEQDTYLKWKGVEAFIRAKQVAVPLHDLVESLQASVPRKAKPKAKPRPKRSAKAKANGKAAVAPKGKPAPRIAVAPEAAKDPAALQQMLEAANRTIAQQHRLLQSSRAKVYARQRQLKKCGTQMAKLRQEKKKLQSQILDADFRRGKKRRYMSSRGGLLLAARNVVSKTGSEGAGLLLGLDIGGKTVRRWTQKLRACQLTLFVRWTNAHYERIRADAQRFGASLQLILHRIRSDATNAAVWQNQKLLVTELLSTYSTSPIFPSDTWHDHAPGDSRKIITPIQVQHSGTSLGLVGVVEKQLHAVGDTRPGEDVSGTTMAALGNQDPRPPLEPQADTHGPEPVLADPGAAPEQVPPRPPPLPPLLFAPGAEPCGGPEVSGESIGDILQIWLAMTDNGPDVTGAQQRWEAEMANDHWSWWLGSACFAHRYQLITLTILWSIEEIMVPIFGKEFGKEFRYYSVLATLMHVWRDNAVSMWKIWVHIYGAANALKTGVHRVAPQPLTWRWAP